MEEHKVPIQFLVFIYYVRKILQYQIEKTN